MERLRLHHRGGQRGGVLRRACSATSTGCSAAWSLITPEQVERARLWMWFYRCASDVPSGLVQQWPVGEGDELFEILAVNMLHVESDGEPAFAAMNRMWRRREPFLSRFDWEVPPESLAMQTGGGGVMSGVFEPAHPARRHDVRPARPAPRARRSTSTRTCRARWR
ncbi:hypothetical protein G5V59_14570 [Nocardioides sp. W3-2-3]|uniref:hypothetical protein n=1 Tax=Nocardioides convexus TaxID=2712224 RepID=UPI002418548C|nr:hypothetical protein [Nocardioides convexus]NHA00768.1 hypothetical protein [Nocardioides convexus]